MSSAGSYTRSEWSALSIRERIRAMNDTLDHVENVAPPKFEVGLNTSFSSFDGIPDNSNSNSNTPQRQTPVATYAAEDDDCQPRRASVVDIWRKRESASPMSTSKSRGATPSSCVEFTTAAFGESTFDDEKKEEEPEIQSHGVWKSSLSVKDIWRERVMASQPASLVDGTAATTTRAQAARPPLSTSASKQQLSFTASEDFSRPVNHSQSTVKELADLEIVSAAPTFTKDDGRDTKNTDTLSVPEQVPFTDSPVATSEAGTFLIDSSPTHLTAMELWRRRTSSTTMTEESKPPMRGSPALSATTKKSEHVAVMHSGVRDEYQLTTAANDQTARSPTGNQESPSPIHSLKCSASKSESPPKRASTRPSVLDRWLRVEQTTERQDDASSILSTPFRRERVQHHGEMDESPSVSSAVEASFPAALRSDLAQNSFEIEDEREECAPRLVPENRAVKQYMNTPDRCVAEKQELEAAVPIGSETTLYPVPAVASSPSPDEGDDHSLNDDADDSPSRVSVFEKWRQIANSTNTKSGSVASSASKSSRTWHSRIETKQFVNATTPEAEVATPAISASTEGSENASISKAKSEDISVSTPTASRSMPGSPASRFPSFTERMHKRVKGRKFKGASSPAEMNNSQETSMSMNVVEHSSDSYVTITDTNGDSPGEIVVAKSPSQERLSSSPTTPFNFVNAWDQSSPKAQAVKTARRPKPVLEDQATNLTIISKEVDEEISSPSQGHAVGSSTSSAFAAWNRPLDSPQSSTNTISTRKDKVTAKRHELVKLGRKHVVKHGFLSKTATSDAKADGKSYKEETPTSEDRKQPLIPRKSSNMQMAIKNFEHLGKETAAGRMRMVALADQGRLFSAEAAETPPVLNDLGCDGKPIDLCDVVDASTVDIKPSAADHKKGTLTEIQSEEPKQTSAALIESDTDPGEDLRAWENELRGLEARAVEAQRSGKHFRESAGAHQPSQPLPLGVSASGIEFSSTTRNILKGHSVASFSSPLSDPSDSNFSFLEESYSMASTLMSSQSLFSGTSSIASRAGKALQERRRRHGGTQTESDDPLADQHDKAVFTQHSSNMQYSRAMDPHTRSQSLLPPKILGKQSTPPVSSPAKRTFRAPSPEIEQLKEELRLTNRYNAASRYIESGKDEVVEQETTMLPDSRSDAIIADDVASIESGHKTNDEFESSCYSTVHSLETYTTMATMENSESILRSSQQRRPRDRIAAVTRSRKERTRLRQSTASGGVASEEFIRASAANVQACRSACDSFSLQQIASDLSGEFKALGFGRIATSVNETFRTFVSGRVEQCNDLNPFDDEDVAIEVEYMGESLDEEEEEDEDDPRDDLGPCSPIDSAFRIASSREKTCARTCFIEGDEFYPRNATRRV